METLMFWIGFYNDAEGNRVKGNWKTSESAVDQEASSYLYKSKLGLTLIEKGKIEQYKVEEIARDHNCTVSAVLSTL